MLCFISTTTSGYANRMLILTITTSPSSPNPGASLETPGGGRKERESITCAELHPYSAGAKPLRIKDPLEVESQLFP